MSEDKNLEKLKKEAISPSMLEKIVKICQPLLMSQVGFDTILSLITSGAFTVINGIYTTRQMDKMATFVEEMIDLKIEEGVNFDNEENAEILACAIDKSLRASKMSQVKAIVKILSAKTNDRISKNDAEDLINIISELSENEAKILQKMYLELENKDINAVTHSMLENWDIPLSKLEYILNRLVGKGLLRHEMEQEGENLIFDSYQYNLTEMGKSIFQNLDHISLI